MGVAVACSERASVRELREKEWRMFQAEVSLDVAFFVGRPPVQIRAHRNILIRESEQFGQRLLALPAGETINLPEIQPSVFKHFIRWIYLKELPLDGNDEVFLGLLNLARDFDSALVPICLSHLETGIKSSWKTALKALEKLTGEEDERIISIALDTICRNSSAVFGSKDFPELCSRSALEKILKLDGLTLKEVKVFKAVVKWAKNRISSRLGGDPTGIKGTDVKEELGNLLHLIRFPLMSRDEYFIHVAFTGILSDAEHADITKYKYNNCNKLDLYPESKFFSTIPRRAPAKDPRVLGQSVSVNGSVSFSANKRPANHEENMQTKLLKILPPWSSVFENPIASSSATHGSKTQEENHGSNKSDVEVIMMANAGVCQLGNKTMNQLAVAVQKELQRQPEVPRSRKAAVFSASATRHEEFARFRRIYKSILDQVCDHSSAWPFLKPVDGSKVPDYYEHISSPMDLKTMRERWKRGDYISTKLFIDDMQMIFNNCRAYNKPETVYYKCASDLETFFLERMRTYGLLEREKNRHCSKAHFCSCCDKL